MAKKENKNPTKPVEDVVTDPVEEDAGTRKPEKAYRFRSEYKALTVASLGVQFRDGEAVTKDVGVARALATIDGVSLVED